MAILGGDLSSALSTVVPGQTQMLLSSSSLAWRGILLEKCISSPGERGPVPINHDVVTLLCSTLPRGELVCGERLPAPGHMGIFRAGSLPGARLHATCELLHCALDWEFISAVREEMGFSRPDARAKGSVLHDGQITQLLMLLLQEL